MRYIFHWTFNTRNDTIHLSADMAELADALDLGSSPYGVQVRFLLSALLCRNTSSRTEHFQMKLFLYPEEQ